MLPYLLALLLFAAQRDPAPVLIYTTESPAQAVRMTDMRSGITVSHAIPQAFNNITWVPESDVVLFSAVDEAHMTFDVFSLTPDGILTNLTNTPDLSETFNRLRDADLYLVNMDNGSQTVLNMDTGERRPLVAGPRLSSISPDGTQGLVVEQGQTWLVDLTTGERTHLLEGIVDQFEVAWSPDGRKAFVVDVREATVQPFWIEDGIATELSSDYVVIVHSMTWTPDSTQVTVAAYPSSGSLDDSAIYTVTRDRAFTLLASTEGREDYPMWSPDGARLAFVSATPGGAAIYLVEDGAVREIVPPNGIVVPAGWSPDGRYLAYGRSPLTISAVPETSIIVLDTRTGETREIATVESWGNILGWWLPE